MLAGQMMNLHKSQDVDLEEAKSLPVAVAVLHRLEDSISKVSAIRALANTATITKSALVLALHRSKIPYPASMDIPVSMENAPN